MKWPDTIREAQIIQRELVHRIHRTPLKETPLFIAGADAASCGNRIIGAACLFSYPGLQLLEWAHAIARLRFPYIPGFLSFREGPVLFSAVRKLKTAPDILIFDGQGIAHPAGMGLATHLGILLNIPAIGCAKSRLIGEYAEPALTKGSFSQLRYREKTVGATVRTRENVRPVFVSPGHMIDIQGAITIVLSCTGRYRIPEPIRRADGLSKEIKKSLSCS